VLRKGLVFTAQGSWISDRSTTLEQATEKHDYQVGDASRVSGTLGLLRDSNCNVCNTVETILYAQIFQVESTDDPHLGLAAASHLAFGLTAAGRRMSAADESLGCEYKRHKMDLNTRNLK
jgi:hypothetical protein